MSKGYYIIASLLALFSLVTYYNFTNKFSLIILSIVYIAYIFSPLLYEIILMSPYEAVIKNIISLLFALWIIVLYILGEENANNA